MFYAETSEGTLSISDTTDNGEKNAAETLRSDSDRSESEESTAGDRLFIDESPTVNSIPHHALHEKFQAAEDLHFLRL